MPPAFLQINKFYLIYTVFLNVAIIYVGESILLMRYGKCTLNPFP